MNQQAYTGVSVRVLPNRRFANVQSHFRARARESK